MINCQSGLAGQFMAAMASHILGKIITGYYMECPEEVANEIQMWFFLVPLAYYFYPSNPDLRAMKDPSMTKQALSNNTKAGKIFEQLSDCTLLLGNNDNRFWFAIRGCESPEGVPCAGIKVNTIIKPLEEKAKTLKKISFNSEDKQDLTRNLKQLLDDNKLLVGIKSKKELKIGTFKLTIKEGKVNNCDSFLEFDQSFQGEPLSNILAAANLIAVDYESDEQAVKPKLPVVDWDRCSI
jgi:hypothetical protein